MRIYLREPAKPIAVPVPLVVVSHGTGGSGSAMDWLALPLARAGMRVACIDHHGNNFVDGYEPEGFTFGWERPRDVSFVLDILGGEQAMGPVGAAGFSFGGFTAAALAGARIDPVALAGVFAGTLPVPEIPEYPGVLAELRKKVPPAELMEAAERAGDDLSDPRIRAVFQVAPGWGPFVTAESLAAIRVPVEIRWGEADTIVPYADIEPYLMHIPGVSGRSAGPRVRHEDYFEPDADPAIRDRAGAEAAAFFVRHLAGGQPVNAR